MADANDNNPVFESTQYEAIVAENSPAGTEVVRVHATDADTGLYGLVTYRFVADTESQFGHLFGINNRTGRVFVRTDGLNREERQTYSLDVMATDDGLNSLPTFCKVVVHVRDVNDNAPQIFVNTLTDTGHAQIVENAPSGTFIAHITVSDSDIGASGLTDCSLDNNNFALEALSSSDYKLISAVAFDRETKDMYVVAVTCHDAGQPKLTSAKNIIVKVMDENDQWPKFNQSVYTVAVREGNSIDVSIIRMSAFDRDAGRNGDVKYSIQDNDIIYVDTVTGIVRAKVTFDYELQNKYQFIVKAMDGGESPKSATTTLLLDIIDANDNMPEFHPVSYEFYVPENLSPNSPVGFVNASDRDSYRHNAIIYSVDPSSDPDALFYVDPNTGAIVTRMELDREKQDIFKLRVVAFNPENPLAKSSANVTVFLSDVNDNAPSVLFPRSPNNTAYVSTHATAGFAITSIVASDRDIGENGRLTYEVELELSDITADLYHVDKNSGLVTVVADLIGRDLLVTRLHVVVRDSGLPTLKTKVDLYIVVSEQADVSDTLIGGLLPKTNLLILLAIFFATTLVILIIVTAMCLAHRKDHRRRTRRDKHETAAVFTELSPTDNNANGGGQCLLRNGDETQAYHQRLSPQEELAMLGDKTGTLRSTSSYYPIHKTLVSFTSFYWFKVS